LELQIRRYGFSKIYTYSGIFRKNRKGLELFSPRGKPATATDERARETLTGRLLLTGQKDRGLEKQDRQGGYLQNGKIQI
jgi:hypothetical protein